MLFKNNIGLLIGLIFFHSNFSLASQGDELWELVEKDSLAELQQWTSSPFNNVIETDDQGLTLLHMATKRGQLLSVQHLLDHIPATATADYGDTPLHIASLAGHSHLILPLVSAGANVDEKNEDGCTALHTASLAGHSHLILPLVSAGANVDEEDEDGYTALHIAIENKKKSVVQSLLECGPDLELQSNRGRTPIELASVKEIADMLFDRGAVPLTKRELAEGWRDDATKDMLARSSQRYCNRLFLIQNLLCNQYNVPAVLQDLIAIDMLVPKNRRKEIRKLVKSHRNKRSNRFVNEAAKERQALDLKRQKHS